jgi:hypothetical protein
MAGTCISYSGTTLVLNIDRSSGSGTFDDWAIVGGGGYGGSYPLIYALGMPNIGNGGFFGQPAIAAPSMGVWWRAWDGTPMARRGAYDASATYSKGDVVDRTADGQYTLTGGNGILQWMAANSAKNGRNTWDTPGGSSVDWMPLSPNSFQELDYDVYATMIAKGNWNAADNAVPQDRESLNGDTLEESLYQLRKPKFFGSLAWPPFDPSSPNQSFTAIPAGYRYVNGTETPDLEGPQGTAAPSNVRIKRTIE